MRAGDFFKAVGVCLALGACAPESSVRYLDNLPMGVADARDLDRPFEATWNQLAANLSDGFFVMDGMEPTARVMDLSFRSDDPGAYIDCGHLMSDQVSPSGGQQRIRIGVTDNAEFGLYRDNGGTMSVTWRTALQARATVLVVPFGERTRVSVLVEYVFLAKATYQSYNLLEAPVGAPAEETTVTRFDTNRPAWAHGNGQSVTCFSKGVLERRILDAAT